MGELEDLEVQPLYDPSTKRYTDWNNQLNDNDDSITSFDESARSQDAQVFFEYTTSLNDTSRNIQPPSPSGRRAIFARSHPRRRSGVRRFSLTSQKSSIVHAGSGRLTATNSTFITINYISIGYILIPYAFALGGTTMTVTILLLISSLSYVTCQYLLEASARAESLYQHREELPHHAVFRRRLRRVCMITDRKFDLSVLNAVFLNQGWQHFFTFTLCCDLYGNTWALCSVFASSFADLFPVSSFSEDYKVFVFLFALVTVPLSCTSILDQVQLQLVFLILRMLMVAMMMVTLVMAYMDPGSCHFGDFKGPSVDVLPLETRASSLMTVIQTAVFSTAFQFSVPTIGNATRRKEKLKGIFLGAVSFIFITNVVLGVLVSNYFGPFHTLPSSNLIWSDYHGHSYSGGGRRHRSLVSKVISTYIVLFAAIDGLAVYPLVALSLGDILMGSVYGKTIHEAEEDWRTRVFYRLLASMPQIVGAFFVEDLSFIATYAGVFTLLSYTACPAMLYLRSRTAMLEEGLTEKTLFSSPIYSRPSFAYGLISIVVLAIGGVIIDAFQKSWS